MLEFLWDAVNIHSDYTIYFTFMLGLTVQFLFLWRLEFLFIHTIQTAGDYQIEAKNLSILMKKMLDKGSPITWILRHIHSKVNPGEDPDDYFLLQ